MEPWKVIGYENFVNGNGEECVRVFVIRRYVAPENRTGAGVEAGVLYYKKKYVQYVPKINDLIVDIRGRYGIDQIMVMGTAPSSNG